MNSMLMALINVLVNSFLLSNFIVDSSLLSINDTKARSLGVDSAHSKVLTKIALGSCNNQKKPQPIWPVISRQQPEAWFWIGDAVYSSSAELDDLTHAYRKQLNTVGYQKNTGILIDGVYDDHDYGVNDAGKYIRTKNTSVAAFLDFISVPKNSSRRNRHGVYSSHIFGVGTPNEVKIIMLDTRYHRDDHFIPSVGTVHLPFFPLIAAAIRWFSASIGMGSTYEGDILGEDQWHWLDEQLKLSTAQVNIVISSIQVLSLNPIGESWCHFPKSKQKLLNLLEKYPLNNLLLFSGDVHFAEFLGSANILEKVANTVWVDPTGAMEVTTSGMTHSLSTSWYGSIPGITSFILDSFSQHRLFPHSWYAGLNFATITFDWMGVYSSKKSLSIHIHDMSGNEVLSVKQNLLNYSTKHYFPYAECIERSCCSKGSLYVMLLALFAFSAISCFAYRHLHLYKYAEKKLE